MPQTTTTQVSPAVAQFYDRTLLKRALPYLAYDKFGQRRPLPKNNSDTIKFRRYNALAVATTPLTEGVTPASTQLSITDMIASIQQYGAYAEVSDKVQLVNVEPVLTEAAEVLGEQAGQSLDQIYRDVITSGTSVSYANGAARNAVNTAITTALLDKAIRTLNNANAKMFTSIIKSGTGIGTVPIRPAYMAIVHPDVQFDLDNLTGFYSVEKYASQGPVMEGEIGAYKNLRFIMSTQAKVWADAGGAKGTMKSTTGTSADIYGVMVFGKDAYGVCELKGEGLRNIVKALGSGGTSDPLNQRATSGWKATTTAKILNDAFMLRLEVAATA